MLLQTQTFLQKIESENIDFYLNNSVYSFFHACELSEVSAIKKLLAERWALVKTEILKGNGENLINVIESQGESILQKLELLAAWALHSPLLQNLEDDIYNFLEDFEKDFFGFLQFKGISESYFYSK